MKDDFEWFIFLAGTVAGIGISLSAFIAVLFLG